MAKRVELSDGINFLPDEILVCILCFMSLKEAAATSILSRRWRYLWTFTNKLNFDGSDFFWRVVSRLKLFKKFGSDNLNEVWLEAKNQEESWNYIAWVNSILGFHRAFSIEEFRIDFLLSEAHKKYIDSWLRFASAKKPKKLELNLRWILWPLEEYTFPSELFINFKHLRTMRLQWVNVSSEGVELILGSSPLLEELSISFARQLGDVKIIGSSLALKRLEISRCYLTSIEIRDVKLEFFMYYGQMLQSFAMKNVPLLEMHLGGEILSRMKDLLLMFSSYLPQLEKLTVDTFCMTLSVPEVEAMIFYNNVKLSNLRQLKVMSYRACNLNMSLVTYFICAAPLLQCFVSEVYGGSNIDESLYFVNSLPKNFGTYKYPHLKRVELIGYRGTLSEASLAVHLLENGSSLEQFIIDLRKRDNQRMINNYFWPNSVSGKLPVGYPYREEDEINAVKARVSEQLTERIPSTLQHLHLNIL